MLFLSLWMYMEKKQKKILLDSLEDNIVKAKHYIYIYYIVDKV